MRGKGWSLDILVVSIPEPRTWALLVLGGGLFVWALHSRRKRLGAASPLVHARGADRFNSMNTASAIGLWQ